MRESRGVIAQTIAGIVLAALVIGGVMLVTRANRPHSTQLATASTSASPSPNSQLPSLIATPNSTATSTPSPSTATATAQPSHATSSGSAVVPPTYAPPSMPQAGNPNLLIDVTVLVNHVDANVGQPTCFNTPLARMTAHVPGPYTAQISLAPSPTSSPVPPTPMTLSPTGAANTYDLTPARCFTFTQPMIAGFSIVVWVDYNQPMPLYGVQFRVGASNQTLSLLSVSPSALSPTHGVPCDVTGVGALFQDVYSTTVQYDHYSEVTDWGDGTAPESGSAINQGGSGGINRVGANPGQFTHRWMLAGTYTVTIKVVDSDGASATATIPVTVS